MEVFWPMSLKLITLLMYQIRLNPTLAPSTNPFGWLPTCRIGVIHWINAVGGVNSTPWWWCLWGVLCRCLTEFLYYSYCRKPTGQEFFVPAQTKIVVKLLKIISCKSFFVSQHNIVTNRCLSLRCFLMYWGRWLKIYSAFNSLTAKLFRREQNSYFLVGMYSIST